MISLLSIYVLAVVPDPTPLWLRTVAGLIGAVLGGVFGFFRGKVTPIRTGELPNTIYVGPSEQQSCLVLWCWEPSVELPAVDFNPKSEIEG